MKFLNIILSSLALLVVVATIVLEGKFKKEKKEKINLKTFKKEFNKLSFYGWLLLILMIILSFGNGIVSYKNIIDNNQQHTQDTIRFNNLLKLSHQDTLRLSGIINELKDKRKTDSSTISFLQEMVRKNGLKSDSIKIQVVDNAIKALNEERKAIERKNDNTFLNLKNELIANIIVINNNYTKENALKLKDSSLFLANSLRNESINNYILISNNNEIIGNLKRTSKTINQIRIDINSVLIEEEEDDREKKIFFINQFLINVNNAKILTSNLIEKTYNLDSYYQFEKLNFYNNSSIEIHTKIIDSIVKDYEDKSKYKIIK